MNFLQLLLSRLEEQYPLKLRESREKRLDQVGTIGRNDQRNRETKEKRRGESCGDDDRDTTAFIHVVLRTSGRMSVRWNWVTAVVRDIRCPAKLGFHTLFRSLNYRLRYRERFDNVVQKQKEKKTIKREPVLIHSLCFNRYTADGYRVATRWTRRVAKEGKRENRYFIILSGTLEKDSRSLAVRLTRKKGRSLAVVGRVFTSYVLALFNFAHAERRAQKYVINHSAISIIAPNLPSIILIFRLLKCVASIFAAGKHILTQNARSRRENNRRMIELFYISRIAYRV